MAVTLIILGHNEKKLEKKMTNQHLGVGCFLFLPLAVVGFDLGEAFHRFHQHSKFSGKSLWCVSACLRDT